jgi:hypothetical protein
MKWKSYYNANAVIILLIMFASCGNKKPVNTEEITGDVIQADTLARHITGERIKGPAAIMNRPGGDTLFLLNDSALVSSTKPESGWLTVGVLMEIQNNEFSSDTLKKGRDIVVDGKSIGKIYSDMAVSTSTDYNMTWAELKGTTEANCIYPWSIAELALSSMLLDANSRSLTVMNDFINDFDLEADTTLNFTSYFNYETWVDDPSPLLRIKLLFESGKLAGVVHSRPLSLQGTTDYVLERGLKVLFYQDVDKQKIENFISYFNKMITSVD